MTLTFFIGEKMNDNDRKLLDTLAAMYARHEINGYARREIKGYAYGTWSNGIVVTLLNRKPVIVGYYPPDQEFYIYLAGEVYYTTDITQLETWLLEETSVHTVTPDPEEVALL